jgi:hypothetical protein
MPVKRQTLHTPSEIVTNASNSYGSLVQWQKSLSKAFINRKPKFDDGKVATFIDRLYFNVPQIIQTAQEQIIDNRAIDKIIRRLDAAAIELAEVEKLEKRYPLLTRELHCKSVPNISDLSGMLLDVASSMQKYRKTKTGADIRLETAICHAVYDLYLVIFRKKATSKVEATRTVFEDICEILSELIDVKIRVSTCKTVVKNWGNG